MKLVTNVVAVLGGSTKDGVFVDILLMSNNKLKANIIRAVSVPHYLDSDKLIHETRKLMSLINSR